VANGHGGKRLNAGRKTEKDIHSLQQVLDEALSHEERVEIFRVMGSRARSGDSNAARVVLGYLYGTPLQRTEISGADGAPLAITIIEAVKPENARSNGDNT
jgi:hypothetical protein